MTLTIDAFLEQPVVARLATVGATVRPVLFLWEEQAFWWLTGSWSVLERQLATDPTVAIVIDICDLGTGEVEQVRARGAAEVQPFDRERAYRKLSRYLGPDERCWDASRFKLDGDATTKFVKLTPDRIGPRIDALDLSLRPSPRGQ